MNNKKFLFLGLVLVLLFLGLVVFLLCLVGTAGAQCTNNICQSDTTKMWPFTPTPVTPPVVSPTTPTVPDVCTPVSGQVSTGRRHVIRHVVIGTIKLGVSPVKKQFHRHKRGC
jgi:hypothetical protein